MGYDAVKLERFRQAKWADPSLLVICHGEKTPNEIELIEWLIRLEDEEIINYLKVVKENKTHHNDWWNDLSDEQKAGVERGLKDIDEGRTTNCRCEF
ncbi:hypothetical protein [Proteiniphilum sp. UBA5384]|uniref:hypothetical protein n=1 Tax=Proteiniphilum sp. UBA5384 TaxID=1947279 RepID=UPI0025D260D9|nr:hypothetical protein [Proteiniphilum sp. UBA5384]